MPWKETNVMDQRKEFVLESLKGDINFTILCQQYGISTKTGYKWKSRFLEEGFAGLNDLSRRPGKNPNKIPTEVVLELIRLQNKKKHWGSKKILDLYKRKHPGEYVPCLSTVERILKKAGYVIARKRKRRGAGVRIINRVKANRPNHVWTVDFKGWWYTPDKERCNPLTVRDDYSKYIFTIKALDKGNTASVKREFERIFRLFGLPEIIRSDNGPPFACQSSLLGLRRLSVWWMSLGIKLDRIDPASPYQNGAHERMHLDMKRELENQIEGNLVYHQKVFDAWRREYNRERPHEGLRMKTPEEVYTRSENKYDPEFEGIEYPRAYRSRMVNDRGWINYRGKRYFIGNPFSGYHVGLKPQVDGNLKVWFGYNFLGELDQDTRLLNPAKEIITTVRNTIKVLPMS